MDVIKIFNFQKIKFAGFIHHSLLFQYIQAKLQRAFKQQTNYTKLKCSHINNANLFNHLIFFSCQLHSCQSAEVFQIFQHLLSYDWFLSYLMTPKGGIRFFLIKIHFNILAILLSTKKAQNLFPFYQTSSYS